MDVPLQERRPSVLVELVRCTRSFYDYARGRTWLALGLLAIGAVIESFGIALLIPAIALLGNARSGWGGSVLALLSRLGFRTYSAQLNAILIGFVMLLILRSLVIWLREVTMQTLSYGFIDHWRNRIMRALVRASWGGLLEVERSTIEFTINNDVSRLSIGTDRVLRGAVSLVMLITLVTTALLLEFRLTLIVVGLLALASLAMVPMIFAAQRLGRDLTVEGRKRHGLVGDFLSGVKLAKAHNVETRYLEDFELSTSRIRERLVRFQRGTSGTSAGFQVLSGAIACGVVAIGTQVTHTPNNILFPLLILLARLANPIQTLMQSMQSMANMIPAFESLNRLEDQLIAAAPLSSQISTLPQCDEPATVELVDVRFRRPRASHEVLQGASLVIGPGELVTLIGPSGAGKTTLGDLLTGLLEPSAGEVRIDGRPLLNEADRAAWRGQVAYVPQDPFLFDHSLRENLRWMHPQASDAEIWAALEAAEAADFVRAMPGGLDTRMGERGQRLSGGERQRICLARALLRRPRLMILDEATNALDRPTELRLLGSLARLHGRLSILMITHRVPTELQIDRHYMLKAGMLSDESEHNPPPPGGGGARSASEGEDGREL